MPVTVTVDRRRAFSSFLIKSDLICCVTIQRAKASPFLGTRASKAVYSRGAITKMPAAFTSIFVTVPLLHTTLLAIVATLIYGALLALAPRQPKELS